MMAAYHPSMILSLLTLALLICVAWHGGASRRGVKAGRQGRFAYPTLASYPSPLSRLAQAVP